MKSNRKPANTPGAVFLGELPNLSSDVIQIACEQIRLASPGVWWSYLDLRDRQILCLQNAGIPIDDSRLRMIETFSLVVICKTTEQRLGAQGVLRSACATQN
jgi:hypothetical protein